MSVQPYQDKMIDVCNVTKRYGQITAVDEVSFSVAKGEILALLGPNGAGKTTTMRILTCFLPATSGQASVAGFDCFEQPMEVKRTIGYLPEVPPLYPEMTVMEYLEFAARLKGVANHEVDRSVDRVLGRVSLGDVRGRLIANLSRGYRQRVGLAQALVHEPLILILDEPTSGLDPRQIIEIRELITSLAETHTVILSTHILPEATAICRRVVIINKGRIMAQDSQERLSANLRQTARVSMILRSPTAETIQQLNAVSGVLNVLHESTLPYPKYLVESSANQDLREDLARLAVNREWGLVELKSVPMTLEDVFLNLTRGNPS
tara:strand:+ start:2249 stop:3211 length:963 start_codon:yes stop_codon:yes gene_type:complete